MLALPKFDLHIAAAIPCMATLYQNKYALVDIQKKFPVCTCIMHTSNPSKLVYPTNSPLHVLLAFGNPNLRTVEFRIVTLISDNSE